jgi:UDP-N-acetyl-alpha-D-muramoyl-L-alanyl-L-glutamate epimerase
MIWHNNFSKFLDLRKEFPFFAYDSYHYHYTGNSLEISYSFNLSGRYFFNPRVSIPYKADHFRPFDSLPPEALDALVFHTGMIELISYWKAACPPKILLNTHRLTGSQAGFWKKVYFHGLGEFFYVNSIRAEEANFVQIVSAGEKNIVPFEMASAGDCLVPVGGGKDSAVTMGLLNKTEENWLPFVINPGKTTDNVIRAACKTRKETIEFSRQIHPQLLALNEQGFLNGHTPFSALLAFYSLLAACLTGRDQIILSNESGASEATVPGTDINHQYSKSFGFEKDFRDYTAANLSLGFNYFSLLRPLSELQIARIFSRMNEFLPLFRSCNVGSKSGLWCGNCPKCLFTFLILSPFIEPTKLSAIFGKNLLDDPGLKDTLDQLSGRQDTKPFDCTGTVDEVNHALALAAERYPANALPYLLRYHRNNSSPGAQPDYSLADPFPQGEGHFVPVKFIELLERELR